MYWVTIKHAADAGVQGLWVHGQWVWPKQATGRRRGGDIAAYRRQNRMRIVAKQPRTGELSYGRS